jgi:hypothetical protein
MRMIAIMADRMLSVVAPKISAAACIDGASRYVQECCVGGCTGGLRTCVSTCFGPACGSCHSNGTVCSNC